LLQYVVEGKTEGRIEVAGGWRRGRKQLLDDFMEKRGYWKLKGEVLDRILWEIALGDFMGLS